MDKYVNHRNGASSRLLAPLLTTVGNDLNVAKNVANKVQADLNRWTNLHRAMTQYYTGSGAGASEMTWAINWEWNTGNVKRDELENPIFKRQACPRPTGTATGDATGSATSSTGDDLSTGDADASSTIEPSSTETSAPAVQTCSSDSDCEDNDSADESCLASGGEHRQSTHP